MDRLFGAVAEPGSDATLAAAVYMTSTTPARTLGIERWATCESVMTQIWLCWTVICRSAPSWSTASSRNPLCHFGFTSHTLTVCVGGSS